MKHKPSKIINHIIFTACGNSAKILLFSPNLLPQSFIWCPICLSFPFRCGFQCSLLSTALLTLQKYPFWHFSVFQTCIGWHYLLSMNCEFQPRPTLLHFTMAPPPCQEYVKIIRWKSKWAREWLFHHRTVLWKWLVAPARSRSCTLRRLPYLSIPFFSLYFLFSLQFPPMCPLSIILTIVWKFAFKILPQDLHILICETMWRHFDALYCWKSNLSGISIVTKPSPQDIGERNDFDYSYFFNKFPKDI